MEDWTPPVNVKKAARTMSSGADEFESWACENAVNPHHICSAFCREHQKATVEMRGHTRGTLEERAEAVRQSKVMADTLRATKNRGSVTTFWRS